MLVDYISGTPAGTFFAVIGLSLSINDPALAQYVGFGLHYSRILVVTYMDKPLFFGEEWLA